MSTTSSKSDATKAAFPISSTDFYRDAVPLRSVPFEKQTTPTKHQTTPSTQQSPQQQTPPSRKESSPPQHQDALPGASQSDPPTPTPADKITEYDVHALLGPFEGLDFEADLAKLGTLDGSSIRELHEKFAMSSVPEIQIRKKPTREPDTNFTKGLERFTQDKLPELMKELKLSAANDKNYLSEEGSVKGTSSFPAKEKQDMIMKMVDAAPDEYKQGLQGIERGFIGPLMSHMAECLVRLDMLTRIQRSERRESRFNRAQVLNANEYMYQQVELVQLKRQEALDKLACDLNQITSCYRKAVIRAHELTGEVISLKNTLKEERAEFSENVNKVVESRVEEVAVQRIQEAAEKAKSDVQKEMQQQIQQAIDQTRSEVEKEIEQRIQQAVDEAKSDAEKTAEKIYQAKDNRIQELENELNTAKELANEAKEETSKGYNEGCSDTKRNVEEAWSMIPGDIPFFVLKERLDHVELVEYYKLLKKDPPPTPEFTPIPGQDSSEEDGDDQAPDA